MTYTWIPGSLLPDVLPWLVLLGLLLLPRNRRLSAWWIWAPVVCAFVLQGVLRAFDEMLPGQPIRMLGQAVLTLTFGLAALWLLANAVDRKSRFKTFLLSFVTICGLGFASYMLGWAGGGANPQSYELFFEGILVVMCGLIIPAALSLGGALCRRRYRPVALLAWTLVCAAGLTILVVLPFLFFGLLSSPGAVMWREFAVGVGLVVGFSFIIVLPFLFLAFANTLFRERLKSLLRLVQPEAAAMIIPARPPELEVR